MYLELDLEDIFDDLSEVSCLINPNYKLTPLCEPGPRVTEHLQIAQQESEVESNPETLRSL